MIHVITDSDELLAALAEDMSLLRDDATAPFPIFTGEDLCAYLTPHNGPRAVAQFAYILGRDRGVHAADWRADATAVEATDADAAAAAATAAATAVVLAFAAPSRQHPALIHELTRGKERYLAELDPSLDLERVAATVLPGDREHREARPRQEPTASGHDEAATSRGGDVRIDPESASADLHEAQRRFTEGGPDAPTVSLLMWWLIGAAQCFVEKDQIVPMLTPRLAGRGLRESVAAVQAVVARARGATGRRRGGDDPGRRGRSPRAEGAPQ